MRSARTTAVLAAALLAGIAAATPAAAEPASTWKTTQTVIASADTYVRSDQPDTNYGKAYILAASSPVYRDSMANPGTPAALTFMKYPVTGLTGRKVISARLMVYSYSKSTQGFTAHRAPTDWTETAVTYNNRPSGTNGLGWFDARVNAWHDLDVTTYITGNGVYGIGLDTYRAGLNKIASRESVVYAPRLVITSEPAA